MRSNGKPTVLMVAYHFPPFVGSSGLHRTLKFCRYLRDHGWQPVVLTVEPRAYVKTSGCGLEEVPPDVPVYRSFCLDTARHLALLGRHPGMLALPDRWVSWWPSGVRKGLQIIEEYQPAAVWSTYPVATAHLIARTLSRAAGLPWVADFRDWMTDADYPAGHLKRFLYRLIEHLVLHDSDSAVFTTESSRQLYRDRYPHLDDSSWFLLPNGYDEADFRAAGPAAPVPRESVRLLHSGYLYPEERNPGPLLEAVAELKRHGELDGKDFSIMFRAPGDEGFIRRVAERHGVGDHVRTGSTVTHAEAVREMQEASALLLMQGSRFERQIPAKAYEYLRAGRPVVTLASSASESRRLMEGAGIPYYADLESPAEIAGLLRRLLADLDAGAERRPDPAVVTRYDRWHQAGRLAEILDGAVRTGPATAGRRGFSPDPLNNRA